MGKQKKSRKAHKNKCLTIIIYVNRVFWDKEIGFQESNQKADHKKFAVEFRAEACKREID